MARLSKTNQFKIYEDTGIPTPEPTDTNGFEDIAILDHKNDDVLIAKLDREVYNNTECLGDTYQEDVQPEGKDGEKSDDIRRVSAITRASISTFPESTYQTDNDTSIPAQQKHAAPIIRPSFRRAESVKRMQMGSPPPPLGTRSPRESILSYYRSRTGTPRSVRSVNSRGSPRRRRKRTEEDGEQQEAYQEHFPLVLLHVTLLPVNLPWGKESMRDLLPAKVLDNLQLLQSKVSDTVLQRGILIPHPREEYELLEERLLEALELKQERVTKCGHFQSRSSTNSDTSKEDNGGNDSDSGLGSSVGDANDDLCAICQHHISPSKAGVRTKSGRWSVKVFAANGLMRASAWTAAWPEMESVDVELLPWISDEMRRKLDQRQAEEEVEKQERLEGEKARIKEIVEEQVRLVYEEREAGEEIGIRMRFEESAMQLHVARCPTETIDTTVTSREQKMATLALPAPTDLPQIYRPSQIPLSVLLKNYLYLLAQDRRNVAVFVLAVLVLVFAARSAAGPKQGILPALENSYTQYVSPLSSPFAVSNSTTGLLSGVSELMADESEIEIETTSSISGITGSEEVRKAVAEIESKEDVTQQRVDAEQVELHLENSWTLDSSDEEMMEILTSEAPARDDVDGLESSKSAVSAILEVLIPLDSA